ncbi:MAG: DUF4397 domain-containing protein, partial [Ignavibacteria bacterium]|nr:DUF4397 domain-containing protein [Ignavibacteria bacterium]
SYTLLATNNYSNLEVLVFENPDKSPGSDKANLRVIHSSANASSVYIKFTTMNRPAQYITLSFKGVSNYLELPAGLVDVVMYRAGTQDSVKYGRLFLDGGRVYSAYVLGFISGTVGSPFSFDMIIDSETNSQDLFNFF